MAIQSNFPSVRPSLLLDFQNTKQLDSRITYTRASTATFYNGVTTSMAEQNLMTYSQDVSNAAWQKASTTVTADSTTAPDGTTTADTVTASAATAAHYVAQNVTVALSTNITHSFYAKAGTQNYVQLAAGAEGGFYANFDLSTGVVGTSAGAVSTSIVSAGSGWYRCIATVLSTVSSTSLVAVLVPTTSSTRIPSWAAAGTETVFLWGLQTEQRSAVSAYTATTTQAITNYIPVLQTAASGVARFDNNPTTGESLGLLIEESRTNLLTYSGDQSNAAWGKTGTTVTSAANVAPDGTQTASLVVASTSTSTKFISQTISSLTGTYTFSVYGKASNVTSINVRELNTTGTFAIFNLSTGAISSQTGGGSATITSVGNGWYRCSISFTLASQAAGCGVYLTSTASYTGDGYSGAFIWGAQLEAGAFPTTYIPTVASQVTRAADNASMTGVNFSSWYRADEGTIFIDANGYQPALIFSNANSGYNNIRQLYRSPSTTQPLTVYEANSGVVSVSNQSMGNTNGLTFKCAYGFKTNDFAGSVNAGTVATDTSGIPALAVDRLGIGVEFGISATYVLTGTFRKIAFYPLKVTSTQLQALTS